MKAIISCNYDPKYLFCLPIVTWGWNKLGVGVVVVMPDKSFCDNGKMYDVVFDEMIRVTEGGDSVNVLQQIKPPSKNAEATYIQCSRLYALAGLNNLNPDEIVVTSDVDMLVFQQPPAPKNDGHFSVLGHDIVLKGQYPICYISAAAKTWLDTFVKGRTLQQCLDDLLGEVKSITMRSDLWSKDQEEAFNVISATGKVEKINRAKGETQFATNRCDRDDWFWAERFVTDGNFFDAHLWRPLYDENNIEKLLGLMSMMYPLESTYWIRNYAEEFNKALI
jgi:hypothetical protein